MASAAPEMSNEPSLVQPLTSANNKFNGKLLKELLLTPTSANLILSPSSLSTVMAVTALGARGSTKGEIHEALNFPVDNVALAHGYQSILLSLQGEINSGYTLKSANRLYVKNGFPIATEFKSIIEKCFLSTVEQLDVSNPTEAANQINKWVEHYTNSKIKELIGANSINEHVRLILVNGVYFKGLWKHSFVKERTRPSAFHVSKREQVQVEMMNQKAKFPYATVESLNNSHVLQLDYQGNRLCMLLILPQELDGLKSLDLAATVTNPAALMSQLTTQCEIDLRLPRFRIESTHALAEPLKKLGAVSMFDPNKANFSGISDGDGDLYVSTIVQKAFIEVNEEGTEVAAATGMMFGITCIPEIIQVQVDHPFLFQIIDKTTKMILLSGCVHNPNKTD